MIRSAIAFVVLLASTAMAIGSASAWEERQVSIDGGAAPLYATLALPSGQGMADAVLILPGSGPTDRNGNFPGGRNDSLRLLAQALAQEGIASLRIDKRGVGASAPAAPTETDLRIETYANDASRWLTFLDGEPRLRRNFILGHSEGALIAILAAQKTPVSGLVLVAGPGRPASIVIREQVTAARLPAALQDRSEAILKKLEAGRTVEDVPPPLAALYRPSVQPYLISWFKYDPPAELSKIAGPALVIQGMNDLQVNIADARRLAGAKLGVELLAIDGMNHVLKMAPANDRTANIALYSNPDAPLADGFVSGIVDFIHRK